MKKTRVVMLGGGYTSVLAYRTLEQRLKRELREGHVEVVVISPESQHVFHGWSGEVLGGIIPMHHYLTPLRPLMKHASMVAGQVVSVDLDQKIVHVQLTGVKEGIEKIAYDHLLLATGSQDRKEGIPGLNQYGRLLKKNGSIMSLRNHLLRQLEQADSFSDPHLREQALSIVVAGGGFAGVEICAAIAELIQILTRFYPVLKKHPARIVLVHSGKILLPEYLPRFKGLTAYAEQQLRKYGVEIRFETRLEAITRDGARLSDGSWIPSKTVVSTIGQSLSPLPGTERLARTPDGRLLADDHLHVTGYENLWTGGDTASVTHPVNKQPCPANALWAIKHGEWAGDNIARAIQNKKLRPFTYPGLGQAASLGVGKGAVELYGIPFTGWVGWLMRLFFFLFFMPSPVQAIRVTGDWLSLPILGRHMVSTYTPGETHQAQTAWLENAAD